MHKKFEIAYGEIQYTCQADNDPSIKSSKSQEQAVKEYNNRIHEVDELDAMLSLQERLTVNDIEQRLLTEKILIIRGNAGTVKSQMLAHETNQLL